MNARALCFVVLAAAAPAFGQGAPAKASERAVPIRDKAEDLFLGLTHVQLGEKTSREGEKKQFMATIELEKRRITRKMLRSVYENAYDMYREGNFEGARSLTATILSIDPQYEQAVFLKRAAEQLEGTKTPLLSERRLSEERFDAAIKLYREGRVVEAANLWSEVLALAPGNLKARYWLRKANQEIGEEHYRKGQEFYQVRRLREALDQFYAALVRDPRLPRIESTIAQVEAEYRTEEAGQHLQEALSLYGKGDLEASADLLKRALELAPGNAQAITLYSQVRSEIVSRIVEQARRLQADRDYAASIDMWKKAGAAGYDSAASAAQIARAKDALRREEEEKKEAARLARLKKKQAEEAKKQEAEEAKKAEAETKKESGKMGGGGIPGIQGMGMMGGTPGAAGGPMAGPAPGPAAAAAPAAQTEADKRRSMTHYQNAMIHFQQNKLEEAYNEATLALQSDPANADADSLKKLIDQRRNP